MLYVDYVPCDCCCCCGLWACVPMCPCITNGVSILEYTRYWWRGRAKKPSRFSGFGCVVTRNRPKNLGFGRRKPTKMTEKSTFVFFCHPANTYRIPYTLYITPIWGGFPRSIDRQPRGCQYRTIRLRKALHEMFPTPPFLAPTLVPTAEISTTENRPRGV